MRQGCDNGPTFLRSRICTSPPAFCVNSPPCDHVGPARAEREIWKAKAERGVDPGGDRRDLHIIPSCLRACVHGCMGRMIGKYLPKARSDGGRNAGVALAFGMVGSTGQARVLRTSR